MKRLYLSILLLLSLLPTWSQTQGLKDAMKGSFMIGTCVSGRDIWQSGNRMDSLLRQHFNCIVADNCMKHQRIHPQRDRYYWRDADQTVRFGEERHMTVIGHCLVWHSQVAPWMFTDDDGQEVSRDTLIARMRSHIHTVVGRYKGRIHGWDVINEAVNDDGTLRQSPYLRIIGPDYFRLAFQFAHEADPDAELYYNDYSMALPAKRHTVCQLVRRLKQEGCRIDAVGMQSHLSLRHPSIEEYERTIDSLAACGVKVMITELDVNVLPDPRRFRGADVGQRFGYEERMNPYKDHLPDSVYQQLEKRYLQLFNLYLHHREQITRVNLWGLDDGRSWLNNFPMRGRTNYPLLFDRRLQPKPVVQKIIDLFHQHARATL